MQPVFRVLASALPALALLAGCSSPPFTPQTPSRLVQEKLAAADAIKAAERTRSTYGKYQSPALRPISDRDSGRKEALMFLKNINFRFFGDIGFLAPELIVSAQPDDPMQPVVFDDPQSFSLHVLKGQVVVPPVALTALINKHSFNFPGAPLRNVRAATRPGVLVLAGEMNRRGKWVPFEMEGPVALENPTTLAYTPDKTLIDGQSATELLKAANVNLDELITIKAPGVVLIRSTIFMNAAEIFPPPRMVLAIQSLKATGRGLELEVGGNNGDAPPFMEPPAKSESFIFIRGGDVKFLTVMQVSALMQIQATDKGKMLDFSLYNYRRQLAEGYFNFRPGGAAFVYLKNAAEMGLGEAVQR
jgi:hypothetical protein